MLSDLNELNKVIKNNKFTQFIDKSTRITPTSATLLDLMITNNPSTVLSHNVVPKVIVVHDLSSVKNNISKPKRQPDIKTFRHLSNYIYL